MPNEKIAVVDFGSSKISGPNGFKKNWSREATKGPWGMAYLKGDDFDGVLAEVLPMMEGADLYGMTGFGHSVVPIYRNGGVKMALVGDEPPLSPPEGLAGEIGLFYGNSKPNSMVRKIAALMEKPDLLKILLGHQVHKDSLQFSSLLSVVAQMVCDPHNQEDFEIFPDEAVDLTKNGQIDPKFVPAILGLSSSQLLIGKDPRKAIRGKEVWVMQDLQADLKVIKQLYRLGMIPEEAWVMETDSVLKRIRNGGDEYDTMRMMGNTIPILILPVLRKKGLVQGNHDVYSFVEKLMCRDELPRDWFYDPRARDNKGVLWRNLGGRWFEMNEPRLMECSNTEVLEAVKAFGWGMAAGMYDGMPHMVKDVVISGGLMCLFGEMQPGWKRVFVDAAPSGVKVHWLKMPDSRVALEMVIRQEIGQQVEYQQETPVQLIGEGRGKVTDWQNIRYQVNNQ